MKIWLDDWRSPPEGYVWAKTAEECFELLKQNHGKVVHMSLDHDIGRGMATGYDLIQWMVRDGVYSTKSIFIHSANREGCENMYNLLMKYKPEGLIVEKRW